MTRRFLITLTTVMTLLASCTIQPPLHLPDGQDTEEEYRFGNLVLELELLWDYEVYYDWKKEWFYRWDETDDRIFGTWELQEPTTFNIRRYYTGLYPDSLHTQVNKHQIEGNTLSTHYYLGYYDILAWNEVTTLDGVQSIHIDEASSLERVTAYTNQSTARAYYTPRYAYAFYQPEFLFSGYYENLHVTNNPDDYDYYDAVLDKWYR